MWNRNRRLMIGKISVAQLIRTSNIGSALAFTAAIAVPTVMPLSAQDFRFKMGAGVAVPVGGSGERRDAGPSGTASVELRMTQVWALRLDAELSVLRARQPAQGSSVDPDYADLRSQGASVNGVLNFSSAGVAPYLLLGIGSYKLQAVDRSPSPYGRTGAIQAGFGLNGYLWKRVNPFLEARWMLHLTDYASNEYSFSAYCPIVIGIEIR